ncbi:hypothetical protein FGLOB1_6858 [Fusarium globosum]|uniref:Uncharacterized protein n=1 Tax=Fusarium globosum TaxID=78864 RepID=A0A8H6D9W1_9HYPO|nr:hypothetical protein FGLOB1_6858 [Fusarium globosum]
MSTTPESSSEHDELTGWFGADPDSRAYAPEMDTLDETPFTNIRGVDSLGTKAFLHYYSFSFKGQQIEVKTFFLKDFDEMQEFMGTLSSERIHILAVTPSALLLRASDFRELCQSLSFAPWISWQDDFFVLMGLGRRLYTSYYDIWFTVPLVELAQKAQAYRVRDIAALQVDPSEDLRLYDSVGMFYLSLNRETRQLRVVHSCAGDIVPKLVEACVRAPDLGLPDDPFTLVTGALCSLLELQAITAQFLSDFIRRLEDYSNSLKFEITEDDETRVKETAIQLRKCLPYMEKISEGVECMSQIIEDTISEHKDCRKPLSIPRRHFRRVEKNLQTLRSKATSFKTYQDSRIRRINLSSLLSLRADSAIKASTEAMTRLTEANREDSAKMNDIAMATKLDSEAMITIAKLTMFYLPSTFVATLFSMGIFNFDFDNGKNGRLVISSQWWMYIIFAIPLTLGTFYWFRAVTRSHKQASQKAEREAKQPE